MRETFASPGDGKLGLVDFVWLASIAVVLVSLSLVQSRNRMFWGDEIMGDYVLRAGSWHRFLELWQAGIDSSGIWFYIFAKPWEWIAGASETSLRLFSTVGLFISCVLIWVTGRRFYSAWAMGAGVLIPFVDVFVLRWQLSNGRCYGLMMAASALLLYLMVRGSDAAHLRPRLRFLVATFFAYDILAGSHILGVLYAGAFLCFQIALDLWTGRRRLPLYVSAAAGTLVVFVLSLPNIRSTAALGKPVFWTVRPHMHELLLTSQIFRGAVETLIVLLVMLVFLNFRRRPSRDYIYLILIGMLGLHTAFVLISRVSTSIYVDRYMLPLLFGVMFLIAELLTQMYEVPGVSSLRCNAVYLLAWVALFWAWHVRDFELPNYQYTQKMMADLPRDLPVVDIDLGNFVEMEFYHHGHFPFPFVSPIDPEVTKDPSNLGGVSGYHEMENFYRLGLDAPDLQPTEEILKKYPDFLLVTGMVPSTWFRLRLQNNKDYEITNLGWHQYYNEYLTFWRVHRR